VTYLEAVNRVLVLMREPALTALADADVVGALVAGFVNDAKRSVEDAHNWNVLRQEWTSVIPAGTVYYTLADSGRLPSVEAVYNAEGQEVREATNPELRRLGSASAAAPSRYAVSGQSGNDLKIRVWPAPNADYTVETVGFKKQADLVLDSDVISVPAQPVVYSALANALRERGEVGGQTAAEIFGLANQYLRDAIAQDAALNNLEYNWYS
jgi:hypothetical protein